LGCAGVGGPTPPPRGGGAPPPPPPRPLLERQLPPMVVRMTLWPAFSKSAATFP